MSKPAKPIKMPAVSALDGAMPTYEAKPVLGAMTPAQEREWMLRHPAPGAVERHDVVKPRPGDKVRDPAAEAAALTRAALFTKPSGGAGGGGRG